MIIDAHSHGLYGKYLGKLESAGGLWTKKDTEHAIRRSQGRPFYLDPDQRVRQLDRNHFEMQVVTVSNWMDVNSYPGEASLQLKLARAINDNMARFMEDSKGRLLCAASVPIVHIEKGGRQEMERAINSLGLKAINMLSNIGGKPLDLPEFDPFWAQAAQMDVPVYIHPVNPVGQRDRSYEAEYDLTVNYGWPFETSLILTRLVLTGIMERYPTLKIVSHHLGGMIPFFMGRTEEAFPPESQLEKLNRGLPKPVFDYFKLFYYDTAVGGSAAATKCAYDVFGASQLVFATDAPWGPGDGETRLAKYPGVIKSLGLPEEDNKKIFEENIRRILKI